MSVCQERPADIQGRGSVLEEEAVLAEPSPPPRLLLRWSVSQYSNKADGWEVTGRSGFSVIYMTRKEWIVCSTVICLRHSFITRLAVWRLVGCSGHSIMFPGSVYGVGKLLAAVVLVIYIYVTGQTSIQDDPRLS